MITKGCEHQSPRCESCKDLYRPIQKVRSSLEKLLQMQSNNQWIKCINQLPDQTCEVFLVYRKKPKDIFFAEFLLPGNAHYTDRPVWLLISYPGSLSLLEKLEVDEVTHWQPLPQPPIEE